MTNIFLLSVKLFGRYVSVKDGRKIKRSGSKFEKVVGGLLIHDGRFEYGVISSQIYFVDQ